MLLCLPLPMDVIGAEYSLNCWDSTWQDTLAELTAIRAALQRKDTAATLLCEHLLTHLEKMDSVRETVFLTGRDWASLKKLAPKRVHRPRTTCQEVKD